MNKSSRFWQLILLAWVGVEYPSMHFNSGLVQKSTGHTPEGVAVLAELSCVAPAFEMAQTMISLISGTSASPSNSDCDTVGIFSNTRLHFLRTFSHSDLLQATREPRRTLG